MTNRIIKAIKDDAIGIASEYFTGLPLPTSSLLHVINVSAQKLIKNLETKGLIDLPYVDWELKSWWEKYYKEIPNCAEVFYDGRVIKLPQVKLLDNTIAQTPLNQFEFYLVNEEFKLDNSVKGITENGYSNLVRRKVRQGTFKNEKNVRLIRIETKERIRLVCQSVYYKDYLRTNLCLDYRENKKTKTLREIIHHDGKLEPIDKSLLANNLGINLLLLTAEGRLIIQKRSKKVAFRKGEYAPSASGTFKNADIPEENSPINASSMEKYILTETIEELGIDEADIKNLFFLGITRELIRGGEPEMFFYAVINKTANDVRNFWKNAQEKYESSEILFGDFGNHLLEKEEFSDIDIQRFGAAFTSLIDSFIDKASIPLLTILSLWSNFVLASKNRKNYSSSSVTTS